MVQRMSLYAGIYRVALRLQRQAEAKHQRRTAMLSSVAPGGGTTMTRVAAEVPQQQQQQQHRVLSLHYFVKFRIRVLQLLIL